jgi:Schlafen, AlbA_2
MMPLSDRLQVAIGRMDQVASELGLKVKQTQASRKYRQGRTGPAGWLQPEQDKMTFDLRTLRRAGREADAIRIHKALQRLSTQPVQLDMAAIPLRDLVDHWDDLRATVVLPFFGASPGGIDTPRPIRPAAAREPSPVVEILDLLSKSESATLEFKASARWDLELKARNRVIEDSIVKTVAGFANGRDGGVLLIGVSDDGNVVGLRNDFKLQKRNDADGFENWLTTLLAKRLGKAATSDARVSMVEVEGEHVCVVRVSASPDAVFDREGENARFFVRMNNSTRELNPAEMHEYARKRFK